jgi:hypothetical protein
VTFGKFWLDVMKREVQSTSFASSIVAEAAADDGATIREWYDPLLGYCRTR